MYLFLEIVMSAGCFWPAGLAQGKEHPKGRGMVSSEASTVNARKRATVR